MIKFQLKNFIIFIVLLLSEIFIALFVHDKFIRPYGGDILVVILVYYFLVSFIKNPPKLLPLYVFLFAFAVEISQYFKLAEVLGIENKVLRIIMGSTFDIGDIMCYFAGCILLFLMNYLSKRIKAGE